MKRIALWLAKRYLNGHLVIDIHDGSVVRGPLNTDIITKILHHNRMGYHLTRSQGKGSRKAKQMARAEAERRAIEESYEAQADPR